MLFLSAIYPCVFLASVVSLLLLSAVSSGFCWDRVHVRLLGFVCKHILANCIAVLTTLFLVL